MSGLTRTVGTLGAAAVGCFAYGVLIEPRDFLVRRGALPVLPPGHDTLRVLHIADLHLLTKQRAKREFLRRLIALEPDFVVNTGDNISEPEAIEALASDLNELLQVPGVFVFGSNDYRLPHFRNPLAYLMPSGPSQHYERPPMPIDDLTAVLSSGGWVDLNEHRTRMELQGTTLDFRGTSDAHENRDDYSQVAGPVAPDADVTIGVTHAPYLRILDSMTKDGVNLILAGHTHGGQVCVPAYGALISNCDLPPQHARGVHRHRRKKQTAYVHVSAGLGMSPYAPFRFACRPEVSLLRLVARSE